MHDTQHVYIWYALYAVLESGVLENVFWFYVLWIIPYLVSEENFWVKIYMRGALIDAWYDHFLMK